MHIVGKKLHTVVGTRCRRVIYNTSAFLVKDDVLAVVSNLQSRGCHCRLWMEGVGAKARGGRASRPSYLSSGTFEDKNRPLILWATSMRTHARNGNRRGTMPRAKHSARGAGELECMSGRARGKKHQSWQKSYHSLPCASREYTLLKG